LNKIEAGKVFPRFNQLEGWCAALRMNLTISEVAEPN